MRARRPVRAARVAKGAAMRRPARLASVLLAALAVCVAPAAAQDATPTRERWAVPPPEDCDVAPRPLADFRDPPGTPRPEPDADLMYDESSLPGRPADPATVTAIWEAAWEHTACVNAGDWRRNLVLVTDEAFRTYFVPEDPDELAAMLAATPEPPPPEQRLPLDVRNVRVLDDGRVGAVVDWCGEANFYVFARVGDRWLYDDEFPVVDGQDCPLPVEPDLEDAMAVEVEAASPPTVTPIP